MAQKGRPIGSFKTHGVPGQKIKKDRGQLFGPQASYVRKGSGIGPLMKERHLNAAVLQPVSPAMTEKVIQDKSTIFSLVGGFYPTFTEDFNNMQRWYDNYRTGVVTVNESFTSSGPGPVNLRGNHVWYEYGRDYMDVVKGIPTDVDINEDGVPDLVDREMSVLDDIFEAYQNWIQSPGVGMNMMDSWRMAVSKEITKVGKNMAEREDGSGGMDMKKTDEIRKKMKGYTDAEGKKVPGIQAPEEIIPELLQEVFGIDMGLENELVNQLAHTKGGAHAVDIIFKFMGQMYVIDVTQSRIMEDRTHSSVSGKFKTDADLTYLDDPENITEKQLKPLRKDLLKHFKEQRITINTTLQAIYEMYQASDVKGKRNKSLREFAKEELGLKSRMNKGDFMDAGDMKPATRKAIDGMVGETVKASVTQVLHMLGMDWSAMAEGAPDQPTGFSDIFVLSEDHPIAVGIDWRLSKRGKLWVIKPVREDDIQINPKATFWMDFFMSSLLANQNIDNEIVMQITNMLWMANAGYMTSVEMVTGLAQTVAAIAAGGSGSTLVAGGIVVFEPQHVNEAIGAFLTDLFSMTDEQIRNLPEVKKAFSKSRDEQKSFKTVLDNIDNPIGTDVMQFDSEGNPSFGAFIDETGMLTSIAGIMNDYLKAHAWAAPYVGVYYQGGQTQNIWPMLMRN